MAAAAISDLISFPGGSPPTFVPDGVERILKAIRSHLGMDVAFASHVTPRAVVIRHADMGKNPPFQVGDAFVPEEGYCQRILDGRLPYLIPDTAQVPEAAALACTAAMPIGSHLSVPLRLSDGSVHGTFCCFSHRPDHSLNDRDLAMMHAFADLAAAQIEAGLTRAGHEEEVIKRVRRVIARDGVNMVYQPIYDLNLDRVCGVEGLARFPDAEIRPPNEWFAEAGEVGLAVDLELAAVRSALRGLRYLPDDLYLAVNISPETIVSGRLGPILREVPAGRIVLEVTEHAVVTDYVRLQMALKPLRKHARIAIDDAGAGYSGLRHILDVEPDIIKLDMSLTRGIDRDPARAALAAALVAFARDIGSQIVAEGVETLCELDAIRAIGMDCAQGYFLRRPMPIAAASQFLIARRFATGDDAEAAPAAASARTARSG